MKIGICDDLPIVRKQIADGISRFATKRNISIEFIYFASGAEVLNSTKEIDILFLDIELGDLDGIFVMNKLIKMNTVWRIVFVSSHEEKVFDAFSLKTRGFIRKPATDKDIEHIMDALVQEYKKLKVFEFLIDNGNKKFVKADEIVYMSAESNYTKVITTKETFLVSGNIKSHEENMEKVDILRVHKSYLVNLAYIEKFGDEIKLLYMDIVIPVGRKFRVNSKEKYKEYIISMVRGDR